jgi:hypothetical protein
MVQVTSKAAFSFVLEFIYFGDGYCPSFCFRSALNVRFYHITVHTRKYLPLPSPPEGNIGWSYSGGGGEREKRKKGREKCVRKSKGEER